MNLNPKQFATILLGGIVGAIAGLPVSFLLKPGTFPEVEKTLGLHGVGTLFGLFAGLFVTLLLMLFRGVRDPNSPAAQNFTLLNGTGSMLLGRADIADDGSYLATEWFMVVFIPVFPVCRYRVTEHPGGTWSRRSYTIHAKYLPRVDDLLKMCGIWLCGIVVGVLIYFRIVR